MKIPYFCCIGAELKRYAKDFDFMNQVYLYKVPTDDTIDEVLAQDYFKAISDTVLQDDIVYIYEPTTEMLYACHFNKQNGHITAEQMSNNIPSLTPDKILISNHDGKIAAGDLSLEYIKGTLSILHCTATLSSTVDTTTTVMMDELEAFANLDSRPSYKAAGALVIDANGNRGIIESVDTTNETAVIVTTFAYNAVIKDSTEAQTISSPITVTGELCVADTDGTAKHSLAIVAGIPTETAEEMDIFGARKFDELPTTDDVTTYDDLNPKKLITKGQVESAVSVKATKSTDFMTPITAENKGATKTEIDLLTTSIAEKADKTDLNLKQDIATALNYDNITACITEIPQDIKLELNNGTLTLKAGSKVYVPNGVGVFDVRNITADQTYTQTTNGIYLLLARQDMSIYGALTSEATSGTTPPAGTGTFYNTTTNSIDWYNASGIYNERHYSFPFAIITVSNGAITSINQIFNGFGCIGSTAFALPGVKALIPNGRNADGTLKNIKVVLDGVETFTDSYAIEGTLFLAIKQDKHIGNYFVSTLEYRKSENLYYYNGKKPINQMAVFAIYTSKNGGKFKTFTIKTVFSAVDYNDTEYIGHQAMPSGLYDNLTLGASGSAYIAPADGYFFWNGAFNTNVAGSLRMTINSGLSSSTQSYAPQGYPCRCFLPVKKGTVITIDYGNIYATYNFAFIYVEGSK